MNEFCTVGENENKQANTKWKLGKKLTFLFFKDQGVKLQMGTFGGG